jgi:hypothetical protein
MAVTMDGKRGISPWRYVPWLVAACLLCVPAIAMRFTSEVNWTGSDFVIMGVMLTLACGTWELAARASGSWAYRGGVALAVLGVFLLIWINLAVGIIDTENDDANMMFAGVIAVLVGGACLARFGAAGMVGATVAAAIAQVAVGFIALIAGRDVTALIMGMMFCVFWLGSAWLFRVASRGVPAR